MKLGLAILGLSMAATSAYASTARVDALQKGAHLVDTATVFNNPSDMFSLPEVATIEYGASSTFGSDAKGGFLRGEGDTKFGFFLGQGSDTRSAAGTINFEGIENPFTVFYGQKMGSEMSWGLGFTYSASSKKSALKAAPAQTNLDSATQSYMNLTGSVNMGMWVAGLNLDLANTAKTTLTTGNGEGTYAAGNTKLFGQYVMDTSYFDASYEMSNVNTKTDVADVSKKSGSTITLGYTNTMKKDGAEFFYGASYVMTNTKDTVANTKTDDATLPVIVGVEADATSWMVLRGSVTQNVLLGTTKTGNNTDTVNHNTTVAAGMGLKFNKSILDMTLSAAGSGNVESDALGAQAAYTYMF